MSRDWIVVEDPPCAERVVVTPSAVLVMGADDASVRAAARKLRSLLRSHGLGHAAAVTPVVLMNGLLEPFYLVDGICLVDAARPYLWRHHFSAPLITAARRFEIVVAIREFAQERANYEVFDERSFRHPLLALRRAVHRREGGPTLVK